MSICTRRTSCFLFVWLVCIVLLAADQSVIRAQEPPGIGLDSTNALPLPLSIDFSGRWSYSKVSDSESGPWRSQPIPIVVGEPGIYTFRKRFALALAESSDHLWFLNVSDVGGAASVYVNGKLLASAIGDRIPSSVKIPSNLLRTGKNQLEIIVDARIRQGSIPSYSHSLAPQESYGLLGNISLSTQPSAPLEQRGGMRRLTVSDGRLMLDGAPFQFKGTSIIRQGTLADLRLELSQLKISGANSVRFLSLPDDASLALCDSLGIVAFAELPVRYLASNEFTTELSDRSAEILHRFLPVAARHPALLAIGLGDGNEDRSSSVMGYYHRLQELVHQASLACYFVTRYPDENFGFDFGALSLLGLDNLAEVRQGIHEYAISQRAGGRPYLLLGSGILCDTLHGTTSQLEQAKALSEAFRQSEAEGYSGFSAGTLADYRSAAPVMMGGSVDAWLVTTGLYAAASHPRSAMTELASLYKAEYSQLRFPAEERDTSAPLSYLLYGFFLLFIFFLLVNLDRRFREYVTRALIRPFNFFSDIRDQRLIPGVQTSLLAIVLAGALGLFFASILNSTREGYFANWLLGIAFSRDIHAWLARMAWSYNAMVLWLTFVYVMTIVLITLALRFASIFVRGRLFLSDTFNVVVWALLPLVFLIPYDLLLPRLDKTVSSVTFAFVLLGAILLWAFYRLLKGTGVLFDIYPTKLYLYGGIAIALIVAFLAIYLDHSKNIFANYSFYRSVVSATELRQ